LKIKNIAAMGGTGRGRSQTTKTVHKKVGARDPFWGGSKKINWTGVAKEGVMG